MLKCVLLGKLGDGKTTVFNKISLNQQNETQDDLESNTLQIYESHAKIGIGFLIVDTPGIGAINDAHLHYTNIIAALTDGPVNRILLVVKQSTRLDGLQTSIKNLLPLLQNYKNLITVIVTHMDQLKKKDGYKEKVQQMIQEKFQINSVIFSEESTTTEELCLQVEQVLSQNKQGQILQFSDLQIEDLYKDIEFNKQLEDGKSEYLKKVDRFIETIRIFLKGTFPQNETDNILHSLHMFVRDTADEMIEDFEIKYGPIMNELYAVKDDPVEAYFFYTVLKLSIKGRVNDLLKIINGRMIYPPDHPFRSIRKCPHCGIYWHKVIGCDDIICGNRVTTKDDVQLKQKKQQDQYYLFKYQSETNVVSFVIENDFKKIKKNKQKKEQQQTTRYVEQKQQVKPFGCGEKFKWDQAPFVDIQMLQINNEQIFQSLQEKDLLYQQEFRESKKQMIEQALRNKQRLD